MSDEELFEKLKSDLAAEVKKQAESKNLPVPFRIGPRTTVREAAEMMALAAYRRVKGNRSYALSAEAKLELAALAIAAQNNGIRNLVPVIEDVAAVTPHWLQDRPAPVDIPALPIDPITGERLRNPWLPLPLKPGERKAGYDYGSQHVIRELSPRLAEWLEQAALHGGPTAKMLDKLEAEKLEAEARRNVVYGDRQWQENKLRPNSGATLTEQGEFAKSITDPWVLETHRAEAKAGSPRLLDTLTVRMALFKRSQESRAIHKEAHEILRNWQAEQQQKAAA